jgi:hypothetical protein
MPSGMIVQTRPSIAFEYEQLSVSTSIQVLTPSKYADSSGGATDAFLTLNGGNIRYTYDSTSPSGTVGHVLLDGGILVLKGQNQMSNFKCYQTGSAGSEISVTYERE